MPGFTRGLDFAGGVAFVGLSQVRESAVFSGIPITERLAPVLIPLVPLEVNGDGVVDGTDYNLFRQRIGTRLP